MSTRLETAYSLFEKLKYQKISLIHQQHVMPPSESRRESDLRLHRWLLVCCCSWLSVEGQEVRRSLGEAEGDGEGADLQHLR